MKKNTSASLKNPTQEDMVFNYLVAYRSITQLEAYRCFGIFGLSKIISTLRKKGFKIETKNTSGLNRFGNKVHFGTYVYKGAK